MVYTVVMVSENPNSILYLLPLKLKVVTVVVTVVVGVQGYSNEDDSRLVCRLENVV